MPTLHWIGKDKVINHHLEVPYRILQKQYTFGDAEKSENKIIHGDNLDALKSLLPEYEGKVKCIYIDPPYNTGNEGWIYNDNSSDPKLKKWLNKVVGKEGEDLTRHDKWLCMMYPRLKLLHKLLSEDGAIFISIDENEISNLRLVMDEIFGAGNFIEQLIWNKRIPKNDKYIGNIHEYILLFVKNKNLVSKFLQRKEGLDEINELLEKLKKKQIPIPEAELEIKKLYKKQNYDRGITLYNSLDNDYKLWGKINVSWPNGQTSGPRYDVLHPKTNKPCKVPERGWRWTKESFNSLLDYTKIEELYDGSFRCGKIWFAKDENTQPSSIKYLEEVSDFLLRSIISTKSEGSVSLSALTDTQFDYPKPVDLIELLLESLSIKDGVFLDSFAGSGTTAHAILNLNKGDGGDRKFILIETEEYAETITAERVKRVIKGYEKTEGTGGDFEYLTLGSPLITEDGLLSSDASLYDIRSYICFTETGSHILDTPLVDHPYWLARSEDRDHYFYFERESITVLDREFLSTITESQPYYTIWADQCHLSASFMKKEGITFRKIPRDIRNI